MDLMSIQECRVKHPINTFRNKHTVHICMDINALKSSKPLMY